MTDSDRQASREAYISDLEESCFSKLRNSPLNFNIERFKQAILNGSWDFIVFDPATPQKERGEGEV